MRSETRVYNTPYVVNSINLIGYPLFFEISDETTLADAPINVRLPPRQAPADSDHHRTLFPCTMMLWLIISTSGIIAATYGILSMKPDNIPEPQRTVNVVNVIFPSDIPMSLCPMKSIMPRFSRAPTRIKRPAKKNMVTHSISAKYFSGFLPLITRNKAAPLMATIVGLIWMILWSKNPAMT